MSKINDRSWSVHPYLDPNPDPENNFQGYILQDADGYFFIIGGWDDMVEAYMALREAVTNGIFGVPMTDSRPEEREEHGEFRPYTVEDANERQ